MKMRTHSGVLSVKPCAHTQSAMTAAPEGRAVEDEFKRGEVGGAHACEGGHQGEE